MTNHNLIGLGNEHIIQRLAALRAGSGDYTGLQRPTHQTLDRAEEVAREMFDPNIPTPSVVPDEHGNVVFIWYKGGFSIEITVTPEKLEFWIG